MKRERKRCNVTIAPPNWATAEPRSPGSKRQNLETRRVRALRSAPPPLAAAHLLVLRLELVVHRRDVRLEPLDVARAMTVDHIKEAGVLNSLTPSRSNGVRTMFDMIAQKLEAMSHGE